MSKIILTRGLPGSGKTTARNDYMRDSGDFTVALSRDEDRQARFGIDINKEGVGTSHQEEIITRLHLAQAQVALEEGMDVLVDATHLNPHAIKPWFKLASRHGVPVTFWDFPIPVDRAIERDKARDRTVGEAVIRRMARRGKVNFETGALPEPPEFTMPPRPHLTPADPYSHLLPDAWIVDTDGTVADHQGVRSPYDTSRYALDKPHDDVISLVNVLEPDFHIIGVSGRSEDFRGVTLDWWESHVGFRPENFFMRPSGDQRPDDVVKEEIYENEIRGKFNVVGVLDDRGRVLRMWRGKGITTFAVGDTDNNDF